MGEFVARWGLVALVFWMVLLGMGVGGAGGVVDGGGGWDPVLAAVWVGGVNALVRVFVLRFGETLRLGAGHPVWQLGVGLALVNAGLMGSLGRWGFGLLGAGWTSWGGGAGPWLCGGLAFVVSWGASCVFRDHAGDWHWITHHGRVLRLREKRGRPGGRRGRASPPEASGPSRT
jgi:hypothetical protein